MGSVKRVQVTSARNLVMNVSPAAQAELALLYDAEAQACKEFKAEVAPRDWFHEMSGDEFDGFAGASDGAWICYAGNGVVVVATPEDGMVEVQIMQDDDDDYCGVDVIKSASFKSADAALLWAAGFVSARRSLS